MVVQQALVRESKDLGRGVAGALIFGTPFLLTMETWQIAWTHPAWLVLPTAFAAVLLVIGLSYAAGFRRGEEDGPQTLYAWSTEAAQVVFQSLAAAAVVLMLYGIMEWREPWVVAARLSILQIVALGLGAALANRMLAQDGDGMEGKPLLKKTALFALGALFFILHIAPTEEVLYLASHAGWLRLAGIMVFTLLVAELVLFELEFRGQGGRAGKRSTLLHWGESFYVFFLALAVSAATLLAFGQWSGQPPAVWVQTSVVLALPATIGGSAARVVVK